MLLRKSLLEEQLLMNQLHYDKLFRTYQVVSDIEKRALDAVLDPLLDDIHGLRKELDLIKANEKAR